MIPYPHIDPIIVRLGPLAVRWYGLMYLLGFLFAYFCIPRLARRRQLAIDQDGTADLLFYLVLGVVCGGRFGYVLFYNPSFYFSHPLQIFSVWEGGMSFHGGLLGVVVATLIYCWRRHFPPLLLGDILVTASTVGLGLGRIGNFINAELWGRVTDVPWGMVFPGAGNLPRHPSQLYEAVGEGGLLFFFLYLLHRREVRPGVVLASFFVGYGLIRFVVEFFRQPDTHLGFFWGGATMGQLLSLPMMLIGGVGLFWVLRKGESSGH